ncbi:MAG TPA: hypothetical protein VHW67_02240 [Solirubrobacteraceae bacterium]|jgi:hypothetical protein|nr:hypothetical protein [Solirubrobacteraceae bacterium]
MPLDRAVLGKMASEQMEALEESYGDDENVQIGAVMTFVEVLTPVGEDEEGNVQLRSDIRVRHNIGDPYRRVGLLQQAAHDILGGSGG